MRNKVSPMCLLSSDKQPKMKYFISLFHSNLKCLNIRLFILFEHTLTKIVCMLHACFMHEAYMQNYLHVCTHADLHDVCMRNCMHASMQHTCISMKHTCRTAFACMHSCRFADVCMHNCMHASMQHTCISIYMQIASK